VIIERTEIAGNKAGGAALLGDYVVENTFIHGNGVAASSTIGGIQLGAAGVFRFNTVVLNSANSGAGGGVQCDVPGIPISASISFGNSGPVAFTNSCSVTDSAFEGATATGNNTAVDPQVASDGSITSTSSCVDHVQSDSIGVDIRLVHRPLRSGIDCGCYESP
jgi:hypothetical protein